MLACMMMSEKAFRRLSKVVRLDCSQKELLWCVQRRVVLRSEGGRRDDDEVDVSRVLFA